MNTLQTILLGVVQGLTEFLPVSSSGHLVIFQNLLGFKEPELLLDCALHLGTLLAVCLYFRSDLQGMVADLGRLLSGRLKGNGRQKAGSNPSTEGGNALLVWWIIVGSIPTALIGILFKDPLENLFGSVSTVGVMLIATGFILLATRSLPDAYKSRKEIGLLIALSIGITQGLAIIPGISRSGTTIALGLMLGLQRDMAGRFSFLLSIPAITGALLLQLKDSPIHTVGLMPMVFGFAAALLVGLLALKVLMGVVRKGHLYYFAPYCWAVGMLVIFFSR